MSLLVAKIIVAVLVIAATASRWAFLERRAQRTGTDGLTPPPPSRRTQLLVIAVIVVVDVAVIAIH